VDGNHQELFSCLQDHGTCLAPFSALIEDIRIAILDFSVVLFNLVTPSCNTAAITLAMDHRGLFF
jgi:hypothetical protein